ncbi:hypothetical protein SASPL_131919 [Salvia splendens]|uniref:Uncharacterized protein n=1 Tax=Salvia splendens TaxID=180675 RepID=A0A8X8X8Q5_SALSN|nr:hypothetical protein SASPL_131919 [Salvia splendens]
MLSTHVSGSRHQAAELRRKNRELAMQEEVKKLLVLSGCVSAKAPAIKQLESTSKPLIEPARKAVLDVISGKVAIPEVKPTVAKLGRPFVGDNGSNADTVGVEAKLEVVVKEVQPLNYRPRQERELKFTAAGWKHDCHGRWFKDENFSNVRFGKENCAYCRLFDPSFFPQVEFDSGEEDPNIVLNESSKNLYCLKWASCAPDNESSSSIRKMQGFTLRTSLLLLPHHNVAPFVSAHPSSTRFSITHVHHRIMTNFVVMRDIELLLAVLYLNIEFGHLSLELII